MQHPMTDRDQSAYADAIKRLTIAMREMLGMGPSADVVSRNEAPPAEGMRSSESTARWTASGTASDKSPSGSGSTP
jgi:hypothetical protein